MATQAVDDEGEEIPPRVVVVNELDEGGNIAQAHTLSIGTGAGPSIFSVGRETVCDVCLDSNSVSRDHASIGRCPATTFAHRRLLLTVYLACVRAVVEAMSNGRLRTSIVPTASARNGVKVEGNRATPGVKHRVTPQMVVHVGGVWVRIETPEAPVRLRPHPAAPQPSWV